MGGCRGWRGGTKVPKKVGISRERGGAGVSRGGEERGCNRPEWRVGACVFLSKLTLICNQQNNNPITSAEPLLASICECEIYAERRRESG